MKWFSSIKLYGSSLWRWLRSSDLSLRYYLLSLYLKSSTEAEHNPSFNLASSTLPFDDDRDDTRRSHVLSWLQRHLRRTPYWLQGHCQLAELALQGRMKELAYASAIAAQKLARSEVAVAKGDYLLSRCFLASGSYNEAQAILESLIARYPMCWRYREDLGASYMGSARFEEAHQCLQAIPVEKRSAPAVSALDYLEQQSSSEISH